MAAVQLSPLTLLPDRDRPIGQFCAADSCTPTRIVGVEIYRSESYEKICDHKLTTPNKNCTNASNAVSGQGRPGPASAAASCYTSVGRGTCDRRRRGLTVRRRRPSALDRFRTLRSRSRPVRRRSTRHRLRWRRGPAARARSPDPVGRLALRCATVPRRPPPRRRMRPRRGRRSRLSTTSRSTPCAPRRRHRPRRSRRVRRRRAGRPPRTGPSPPPRRSAL